MLISHNVLLVLAFAGFAYDAYQNPVPTRLSCVGAAFVVASMISW